MIIDEAFMADQETMFEVIKICTQVPLRQQLRQPGSLPLFGYRHVLMFGDLRQLPPASGNPPFWASETFQTYFEIFVLREDRRHEKDAEMRELKELIAWGGHAHKNALPDDQGWQDPWPIDQTLFDAIVDMTLQGIGVPGETVDLDKGTAIFARHVEKDLWNNAYIKQIETK